MHSQSAEMFKKSGIWTMGAQYFLSVTRFTKFAHLVPLSLRMVLGGNCTTVCEPAWLSNQRNYLC